MPAPQAIYVAKNGQQTGPFSPPEIKAQLQTGDIAPTDLAWYEGLSGWTALKSLDIASEWLTDLPSQTTAIKVPVLAGMAYTPAHYAGFWRRVAAHLIDTLLFLIAGAVAGIFAAGFRAMGQPGVGAGLSQSINWIGIVIGWFYSAKLESSRWQGTVGKWLLGIRVTDLAGNRISFGKASGRYFGKSLSLLTLCIGFMMAGWTKRKQALHDMVAKTLVVRDKAI
jgi:uncharacterized RDD family membrane protein YckC